MLVTAGERISMTLLTMAIKKLDIDAISFTGSQSGIITENRHQGARILEIKPQRIIEALASDKVVIIAGYQGVSREREVTTLGRGGSDTSAVAMAAALQAEVCEIYSDVDGVYSTDPRICDQARHLADITFQEMQTMSNAGAKVLNAQAVEFARKAGIVIHARKAHSDSQKMTKVHHLSEAQRLSDVVAVVGAAAVEIEAELADVTAIYGAMESAGAQLHHAESQGETDLSVWLIAGMSGVEDGSLPASIPLHKVGIQPVSTVTVVVSGASLVDIENGDEALQRAEIFAKRRRLTASSWTWLVERDDEQEAVRTLHRLWCEPREER